MPSSLTGAVTGLPVVCDATTGAGALSGDDHHRPATNAASSRTANAPAVASRSALNHTLHHGTSCSGSR